jgi:hypothetical protein
MDLTQQFYSNLFDLLKTYGLNTTADLKTYPPDGTYDGRQRYYGTNRPEVTKQYTNRKYGWVPELYNFMASVGDAALSQYLGQTQARLFFDHLSWLKQEKAVEALPIRGNYACLFPRRTIFLSDDFKYIPGRVRWALDPAATDYWRLPYEFLLQAFVLKPLLLAGLAFLAPGSMRYEDFDLFYLKGSYWSTYTYVKSPSLVVEPAMGSSEPRLAEAEPRHDAAHGQQIIRAPWLQGIDLASYVELVQEEEESFQIFDRAISRTFQKSAATESGVSQTLEDISTATMRLDRMYHKRRHDLNFKGMTVAVGSFMTVGTFIDPALFKVAAEIVGGATIMEGISWLRDRASLKRELSEDEYWFLWKALPKERSRSDKS